ncbi:HVO_A0114 family putative DNA-binding protein [Paraburkholderia unamae]|uniref:HVO_A0114 family putative DNA-binding protein n=1 Tax=Paraburkholderia unamae TaxID=219649 RepID=UPI00403AEA3B
MQRRTPPRPEIRPVPGPQRQADPGYDNERGKGAALTPRRIELLCYLHREADSVIAIARALGRDFKRVHEDVATLVAAGLIVREDGQLRAPWDTLAAELTLQSLGQATGERDAPGRALQTTRERYPCGSVYHPVSPHRASNG